MMIGMLLETLGVGMIVPAVNLLTQNDVVDKYLSLTDLLKLLGHPTPTQLIVAGMLALVAIYAIKGAFLGLLAWFQASFVSKLQADLSRRLFSGYLHQPYTFHLQRNSAQLIRNTLNQTGNMATVYQHALTVVTEVLVICGLSALLLVVEPFGALVVVLTLGAAGWTFYRITRTRLLRWGEEIQVVEGLRIQRLQEGLGGVKDVKLFGRENAFVAQYQIHNIQSSRIGLRQATLQALPRLGLELLAVMGLAGLVLTMIGRGTPLDSILPTLGLFAAAAFRLMPSVNRTLNAVQTMRFSWPMVDSIYSEFQLIEASPQTPAGMPMRMHRSISLESISFTYPLAKNPVLTEINLTINAYTCVGFIGSSGAGKSTLVDIILGLFSPAFGSVTVDEKDIHSNLRGWQDQIGYVPQSIFLTDDTLRRNIAFGIPEDQIDNVAVRRAIRAAQLEQFVSELPAGLETFVGERGIRLSGGQRQRIGIARALYHDPSVLVLDEATSSLDVATEAGVMDAVRALKGSKTIIIVAHRLTTIEKCDRVFRFERGHLVQEGAPEAILGLAQSLHLATAKESQ